MYIQINHIYLQNDFFIKKPSTNIDIGEPLSLEYLCSPRFRHTITMQRRCIDLNLFNDASDLSSLLTCS